MKSPFKVVHNIDEEGRKRGCPTGQSCDICNLYRPTYSEESDGKITQTFDCQHNNIAMLLSELKGQTIGVQQAVESSRNESCKRQDVLLRLVASGAAGRSSAADTRLEPSSAPSESLPSPPEPV